MADPEQEPEATPPQAPAAQDPASTPSAPRKSALEAETDYSKYEIRSKVEILYLLRRMLNDGSLITVYFNLGKDFLLTSLVDVAEDGKTMVLDLGSNSEMNRRAVEADKLICVSTLGKVKIQFTLAGAERRIYDKRDAFFCAVPDSLVRVQRREYYRLATPLGNPLSCQIPIPADAGGPARNLEAIIVDISGGGMAVMVPPDDVHFQPDAEFANCRIDLPEVGSIIATLRVHNLYDVSLTNGKTSKRSGCQFVKLPGAMVSLIQRYIFKVERERKAREAGLL